MEEINWNTASQKEEGRTVAKVIVSQQGNVSVEYLSERAKVDNMVQQEIKKFLCKKEK